MSSSVSTDRSFANLTASKATAASCPFFKRILTGRTRIGLLLIFAIGFAVAASALAVVRSRAAETSVDQSVKPSDPNGGTATSLSPKPRFLESPLLHSRVYSPLLFALGSASATGNVNGPFSPSTIAVTNTNDAGAGSLRQAVADASDGDTIIFQIPLTDTNHQNHAYTIKLSTGKIVISKSVTIKGPNSGADTDDIIISGNHVTHVFQTGVLGNPTIILDTLTIADGKSNVAGGIINAATLTITNTTISNNSVTGTDAEGGGINNIGTLTITNSTLSNNSSQERGGGIFSGDGAPTVTINNSTLSNNSSGRNGGGIYFGNGSYTITNSTLSNNSSGGSGGGIFDSKGTVTITGTTLSNNSSSNGGGAVYNTNEDGQGSLTITNSTVSNNSASAQGGAILTHAGSSNITNSTISGNSAVEGGGIYNYNSNMIIANSTISNNVVSGQGGGVSNSSNSNLSIRNSTLSNNSASGPGGGVYSGGRWTITNSTLFNNSASQGGGVYHENSTANVGNCTLSGNSAGNGGGILNAFGVVKLRNSIIAANSASSSGPDVSGLFSSPSHNVIGKKDGSSGLFNGVNGNQVGTSAAPLDPKLGSFQNNGGPTQTMALLSDSPAKNAGDDCVLDDSCDPSLDSALTTDQRGTGFTRKVSSHVDIGAFELTGADLSVISLTDTIVTCFPGNTLVYGIAYANFGNAATGVKLTETVPVGTTFDSAHSSNGWTCAPNNNAGSICTNTIGALAASATGTKNFAVIVNNPAAAALTQIVNTASIADDGANGTELDSSNNSSSDTDTLDAAPAFATFTKSDSITSTTPGSTLTYTINYANTGNQNATGVVLTETVPTGTTFVATGSSTWTNCANGAAAGTQCTLSVGNVAGAGGSGSASFKVKVNSSVPAGFNSIVNNASIRDDGNNSASSVTANASDTDTLEAAPDLVITKSADINSAAPGQVITYTLNYSNIGTRGAAGVQVTETVPANTTFVASGSSTWTGCVDGAAANAQCTNTVGALAANAGGTLTFKVKVNNTFGSATQTTNVATIDDDHANGRDPNTNNNSTGNVNTSLSCGESPVTNTNDSGNGSLRQAITQACDGGTITFQIPNDDPNHQNNAYTINLATGKLAIGKSLTINGPNSVVNTDPIIISGNNATRVFQINSGTTATLSRLTITGGHDVDGGGIFNSGTLNVNNSTISGNTATAKGGGINNNAFSTVNIINSTISGNFCTGFSGGGIQNGFGSTANATNSTISGNSATNGGGGGIQNDGTLNLTNTTISANSAQNESGGVNNYGTVNSRNSIMAGNAGPSPDFGGAVNSQGHNLIGNTAGSSGWVVSDLQNVSPSLSALQNNGGPTETMALQSGSPARDSGDDCVIANTCNPSLGFALTTDQRGAAFTRKFGAHVDIGAVEAVCNVAVTNTNDSGAGSLRQAISVACEGGTINFQIPANDAGHDTANHLYTITLTTGELAVGRSLAITGTNNNGADTDAIVLSGNDASRVFNISGGTVTLDRLTIVNGKASGFSDNEGGGILNRGYLTITNSTLANNSATSGNSGSGGAIYNAGTVIITNGTLSNNSASGGSDRNQGGGGIFNSGNLSIAASTLSNNSVIRPAFVNRGGGIYNVGATNITDSTLSNNTVGGSFLNCGGGIYNSNILNITNSTLSNNSASAVGFASLNQGGGIQNDGRLSLANSTLSNNSAHGSSGDFGGGIFNSNTMVIANSTFSNNSASGGSDYNQGGGIYNGNTLNITDSTLSNNSASGRNSRGGGIDNDGTANARNTIIAGNSSSVLAPDVRGNFTSQGHNLIGKNDGSSGFTNGGNSDQVGSVAAALDPMLGPLQNNGGATMTIALLPGSPALEAGTDLTTLNGSIDTVTSNVIVADAAGIPEGVNFVIEIDSEQMTVTSKSDNTLTVTRHANGTPAASHDGGAAVNPAFDQRGTPFKRKYTTIDIGAFESRPQSITVTTHAPASAGYNTTFGVAATAGSGLPVSYSSTGACTNVGPVFTMTSGTGTCTVKYDQSGDGNYNSAPQVTESVTAQKIDQTIAVATHAPANTAYNTSFTVAATSGSGLAVSYSSSGSCTNVGETFTMTASTGICTVKYDQAGDANYKSAPQVTESVTAEKADQTITVGTNAPSGAVYNTSFTVAATSSSGLPVSYSSSGACTNVGATFTMTSSGGTCTVNYDQPGNNNYNSAPRVSESVTAQKADQTITVSTHAPASAADTASFTVAATSSIGFPISYLSEGSCSNLGATFTMTSTTGLCTVKYEQAGDANYKAAQVIEYVRGEVTYVVDNRTDDGGLSTCTSAPNDCSLRGAIAKANFPGNVTIEFDSTVFSTPQTITLSGSELTIANDGGVSALTVNGRSVVTVSGDSKSRVLQINDGTDATLNGLTVTGGSGGGILNNGTLRLTNSTVSGNSGGGISNKGIRLDVINSTISGNFTLAGGRAGSGIPGGGISNANGTLNLINSTISGNVATGSGGGIFSVNVGTTLNLINSTVSGNSSGNTGGGILTNWVVNIGNSIIAGNTAPSAPDISGSLRSQGYNVIGNMNGGSLTDDLTGNILNQDARLGPLQDNGGPTRTHALLSDSPAINAGSNALAVDLDSKPLATDQRGIGFPRVNEGTVDIGAFESGKRSQSITVGTHAPASASYNSSFTVAASSNSGLPVSYSSSGACTNVGATFTMTVATGPCTVKYDQAGNSDYDAAPQVTESVSAQKTDQTITVVTHAPPSAGYNSDFIVAATATSGLPVSYSSLGACTNVGATFHMTASIGTCTVRFEQAGNSDYNAAPPVSESVMAQKANQTITFGALDNKTFGDVDFNVSATASSNLTVSFGASGNCTITGNAVHITGAGSCTITAKQAGDGTFNAATDVAQGFTIGKSNQTITFGALANKTFGDADFNVSATASSNLGVSFGASGNCTITSNAVHITGASSCTITAKQAGDANFNEATDVAQSFTIGKSNQTITFGPLANKTFGDVDFNVSATASSNLGVSFGASGNCTVTGNTVHVTGAGACTITAMQAGDANFNAAANVDGPFTIAKANQTITFGALANKTFGDADFIVSATASSGLAVSFAASGNCTIGGNTAHITGGGACTITASQAGDVNYGPAANVQQPFTIAKATPTVTFSLAPTPTYLGGDFTVSASTTNTDSSTLTYSRVSGPCALVSGSTFSSNGAGTCVVAADGVATTNFNAASNTQNITIAKATPTLTFGSAPTATYLGGNFTVSASTTNTDSSMLTYSRASGPCTLVTGSTFSSSGAGTCVVQADGVATTNFNAASNTQNITIAKATPTVTFGSAPTPTYLAGNFTLSASTTNTDSSTLTYSRVSGPCALVSGSTFSSSGAGTCVVQADGVATTNFNAASNTQNVSIAKASQTITFGTIANKTFGDPDFNVSATASSTLAVSFAASGQCAVSGSTVHLTSVGSCTITARQAGDANYNAAADVPRTFNINGAVPSLSFSAANYDVDEITGLVTVTVNRTGVTTNAVTVDYAIDDTGAPVSCATVNGMASSRCDFTAMYGALNFAANETQKTLNIPISQDALTEGPETFKVNLSNPSGGAVLTLPSSVTVTINDSPATLSPNAIDDTTTFVRQQYRDFLNREADPAGLAFWKNNIDKCNDSAQRQPGQTLTQCLEVQRILTSGAFFLSIEFQYSGVLVYNFYAAALNRPATGGNPTFAEFLRDTQAVQRGVVVGQAGWQTTLDANRTAFMNDFVMRPEFIGLYPTTDSPTIYVNKLYKHALNRVPTTTELNAGVNEFNGAGTAADPGARGRALLRITQALDFQQEQTNRCFVLMEYFGYLRRNPNDAPDIDLTGFNFWVNKLNQFNGDFLQAEMVKAFISSAEYRQRFGS